MSSRYCHGCEVRWPPNEEVRSGLGGRSLRPVNEWCPACGAKTTYDMVRGPSDEDDRNELLTRVAAQRARDALTDEFDAYYAARALSEFTQELETWARESA